jgi:asparagine synthase (glutamine-hydrolysing)
MPVDKCSMAASLEMRVPYLDDGLVDLVSHMPLHHLVRSDIAVQKYILRRLAILRFGTQTLDVVMRRKIGAPVSGIHMLERFDQLCNEMLPDSYVRGHPFGYCFGSKREAFLFDFFLEIFLRQRGDAAALGGTMEFLRSRANGSRIEWV